VKHEADSIFIDFEPNGDCCVEIHYTGISSDKEYRLNAPTAVKVTIDGQVSNLDELLKGMLIYIDAEGGKTVRKIAAVIPKQAG